MTKECPLGRLIHNQSTILEVGQTVQVTCNECSGYANVTGVGDGRVNTAEKRECHEMWTTEAVKRRRSNLPN